MVNHRVLADCMEIDPRSVAHMIRKREIKSEIRQTKTKGRPLNTHYVSVENAYILVASGKQVTLKGMSKLNSLYGMTFNMVNQTIIQRTESKLSSAIKILIEKFRYGCFTVHRQYNVGCFLIDIAIVSSDGNSMIAIEHDGHEHVRQAVKDKKREEEIHKKFNGTVVFYRCEEGLEMECVARVANILTSDSIIGIGPMVAEQKDDENATYYYDESL